MTLYSKGGTFSFAGGRGTVGVVLNKSTAIIIVVNVTVPLSK
jgi:hypothetical protein